MGRPAYGVKGIELAEGDLVIGMVVANGDDDPASLLTSAPTATANAPC